MITRTKRQREILKYIDEFIKSHEYQPSYQQIANHLELKSKGGIAKHIEALEKKGLLSRNYENGSFQLEVNQTSLVTESVCEIEWLLSPDVEERDFQKELLYVPKFMLGHAHSGDVRAFLVQDNSMTEENICEDDIAFVEAKTFVRDGELITAMLENKEIVLRRFFRTGADIELAAANENYESIVKSADRIEVLGIFRGLLRPSS